MHINHFMACIMNCVCALSWWPTWPARPALLSPQKNKLGIDSIFGPVCAGFAAAAVAAAAAGD